MRDAAKSNDTKRRIRVPKQRADRAVARLLRAIDQTIVAAEAARRARDELLEAADSTRGGCSND